ncbi:MAG: hypothetical protein ACKOHG_09425, partial [Planctomycetia bacterium]
MGTDARAKAKAAWAAFDAFKRGFSGPFANGFANVAPSGGADAAPTEEQAVLENTDRKQTRPGVIRTRDQGMMSPLLTMLVVRACPVPAERRGEIGG